MVDGRDISAPKLEEHFVFARGHSVLGQAPFTRPSRIQVPLSISPAPAGSLTQDADLAFPPTEVHPYDVVLADLDGVVVVRPSLLEQVLQLAQKGSEVDERCRLDLLEGKGVKETFKRHRGK
ncbi:hypothetical protein Rhopal_001310-T1 [Rhodotorula paludigena]|uniref:Uncharacterized protein n=1 Tax=Rhodotorula paludigena TaxID=86838 RepID=A0AAV5GF26_9BASI|nr:hypothetical protein Rhopal_001310-T1 [Rhodotorula paludigena]